MLSSERVFGGMEFEPMLTPREKSPILENFPRGGSNLRRCGQQGQTLPTSYSVPPPPPPQCASITRGTGGSVTQPRQWPASWPWWRRLMKCIVVQYWSVCYSIEEQNVLWYIVACDKLCCVSVCKYNKRKWSSTRLWPASWPWWKETDKMRCSAILDCML